MEDKIMDANIFGKQIFLRESTQPKYNLTFNEIKQMSDKTLYQISSIADDLKDCDDVFREEELCVELISKSLLLAYLHGCDLNKYVKISPKY